MPLLPSGKKNRMTQDDQGNGSVRASILAVVHALNEWRMRRGMWREAWRRAGRWWCMCRQASSFCRSFPTLRSPQPLPRNAQTQWDSRSVKPRDREEHSLAGAHAAVLQQSGALDKLVSCLGQIRGTIVYLLFIFVAIQRWLTVWWMQFRIWQSILIHTENRICRFTTLCLSPIDEHHQQCVWLSKHQYYTIMCSRIIQIHCNKRHNQCHRVFRKPLQRNSAHGWPQSKKPLTG